MQSTLPLLFSLLLVQVPLNVAVNHWRCSCLTDVVVRPGLWLLRSRPPQEAASLYVYREQETMAYQHHSIGILVILQRLNNRFKLLTNTCGLSLLPGIWHCRNPQH